MFDWAICEISGKQYKVLPNKPLLVDWLSDKGGKIDASILLICDGGKIKIGTPYLKEKLTLNVVETVKSNKIRVAKFHAKANYRKVIGNRAKKTKIIYPVKKMKK